MGATSLLPAGVSGVSQEGLVTLLFCENVLEELSF